MNNEQAKNGFKTFLVTFVVSVLVFGAFYYLISDSSADDVSIEGSASTSTGSSSVLGYTTTTNEDAVVEEETETTTTTRTYEEEVEASVMDGPTLEESYEVVEAEEVVVEETDTTESSAFGPLAMAEEKNTDVAVTTEEVVTTESSFGSTTVTVENESSDVLGINEAYTATSVMEENNRLGSVLSGTNEATQSTVPETGDVSITLGIVASISLLGFFFYILYLNPRKYALAKFEKNILDDLE